MIPTRNSRVLARHLPTAELTVYRGAGHGFLFQYPAEFAAEVDTLLG